MWPTLHISCCLPQGGVISQLSWSVLQEMTKDHDEKTPGHKTHWMSEPWTSHRFLWQQFQGRAFGFFLEYKWHAGNRTQILVTGLKLWEDWGLGRHSWDDGDQYPEISWNLPNVECGATRPFYQVYPHTRNMKDQLCRKQLELEAGR